MHMFTTGRALVLVTAAALATLSLGTTAASAGLAAPKATGGILLENPTQYVSFSAFDTTPAKGSVTYTNFDYEAPGSGAWLLESPATLVFTLGTDYVWTMTLTSRTITGNASYTFTGSAVFNPDHAYTADVTGKVDGANLRLMFDYTGAAPDTTVDAPGMIAADGSVAGVSAHSEVGALPWSMPAGSLHEVLMYTAPVTTAHVDAAAHSATFGYVIPAYAPAGLAGLPITMAVHDGGTPGTAGDTFGVNVAPNAPTRYVIVAGNLVVHS